MASSVTRKANKAIKPILVTSFTLVLLMMFLSPFAFMVFTSLKTPEQISVVGAPIWPAAVASFEYNGKEVDMYTVPLNTCEGSENHSGTAGLALVKKGTRASTFVDPDHLDRGEFVCQVSWRAGPPVEILTDLQQLQGSLGHHPVPAPAVEHHLLRDHEHHRGADLVYLRRLRLLPV